jgi:hypothetical protein
MRLSPNLLADPDLDALIVAWPTLPADVRKMILGVVKVTINKGER